MNQKERRYFLIKELLKEQPRYRHMEIPGDTMGQKQLLRSLMNIRMPGMAGQKFLEVQDAYLQEELAQKGIVDLNDMEQAADGIYLWQGDITRLRCDAIVNAANSGMTGCYVPCHGCIDNCIHTYAGIQLRLACAEMMERQGDMDGEQSIRKEKSMKKERSMRKVQAMEKTGGARITPAFNLPCRYVIHTVGPIVSGRLTEEDKELLASCYRSCLELAEKNSLESIAFCCISTGEFHFPNEKAAEIAIQTVKEYKERTHSKMEVVFNVFKDADYEIYKRLLF